MNNQPKTDTQSSKMLVYMYAFILILVWGTAYTMVGFTVKHLAPAWIVAARCVIAAIMLTAYIYMRGHKLPPLTDKVWAWYGVLGFIGMTAPFYLMARAQLHVGSGLTSILVGFMPLATIVLAHFFVKDERLSWRKAFGFLVGFAGVVILFLPENFALGLIENWRSQSLILIGAVLYALTAIIAKRAPEIKASIGATMMVISAAVWGIIWVMFTGLPETMPPNSAIWAVFGIALGSTAFAQILYLHLVKTSGPTFIAKLNYLVPICALAAGVVFLGEDFGLRTIAAMAVIFAGLFIARSGK